MKENYTNFEQFEALLKQKHYDDLSEKEKGIVAEHCDSSQEYRLMRQMILACLPKRKAQVPIVMASDNVPQDLLEKVAKNVQPSGYQRFVNYKIPFWAYLLSLFVVFGLTYFLRPNPVEIKETIKEVPKEIIKTDTVVQYAYRVDTLYLESKKSPSRTKSNRRDTPKASLVTHEVKQQELAAKKKNQHPVGRTIKQDRDLKAFFTDIQ